MQAPEIMTRQRQNGPICCCTMTFEGGEYHSYTGGKWQQC